MTEAEWLAATGPMPMLEFARYKRHARKLRLFASGCCRRIAAVIPEECGRRAVDLAERFADGDVPAKQIRAIAREVARATADYEPMHGLKAHQADQALTAALNAVADWAQTIYAAECAAAAAEDSAAESAAQCHLIRDIFGNPFRPIAFDPRWRSASAVALATGIYAERSFDRLPILADALEEAGCDDTDVLAHCRGPGPHVRGCWVVDRVLDKE